MTVLLLLILLGAPGYAFWLLVPGIDPIGRLVVASLASLVAVSVVSEVMLAGGFWSPPAGFAAVLVISGLLALTTKLRGRGLLRRRKKRLPEPRDVLVAGGPKAAPAPSDPDPAESGDEWIYDA